jgi:DeoR/GlpR family transcriptional regulator of sugar metabolism
MLKEERQNLIMEQINAHEKVLTIALTQLLNVSLDTVRRDLTEMEEDGKIVKVHGGAISKQYQVPFQQTSVYKQNIKQVVAAKALTLLTEGMSILLSGGTIVLELVKLIPKDFKGLVYTVSPLIALELAQRTAINVILLGGHVSKDSYLCTGSSVINQINNLRVDLCILGSNGLSAKNGLTDIEWEIAHVKSAIIANAKKVAILSISEKLEIVQEVKVCDLKQIDYLITELPADDASLGRYAKHIRKIL